MDFPVEVPLRTSIHFVFDFIFSLDEGADLIFVEAVLEIGIIYFQGARVGTLLLQEAVHLPKETIDELIDQAVERLVNFSRL